MSTDFGESTRNASRYKPTLIATVRMTVSTVTIGDSGTSVAALARTVVATIATASTTRISKARAPGGRRSSGAP